MDWTVAVRLAADSAGEATSVAAASGGRANSSGPTHEMACSNELLMAPARPAAAFFASSAKSVWSCIWAYTHSTSTRRWSANSSSYRATTPAGPAAAKVPRKASRVGQVPSADRSFSAVASASKAAGVANTTSSAHVAFLGTSERGGSGVAVGLGEDWRSSGCSGGRPTPPHGTAPAAAAAVAATAASWGAVGDQAKAGVPPPATTAIATATTTAAARRDRATAGAVRGPPPPHAPRGCMAATQPRRGRTAAGPPAATSGTDTRRRGKGVGGGGGSPQQGGGAARCVEQTARLGHRRQ